MGAQRILQAARAVGALAVVAGVAGPGDAAAAPKRTHESVAVIDLGPPSAEVRRQSPAGLGAGRSDPGIGDCIGDALAGEAADKDAVELAAAIAEAQRAFGALDCAVARAAGTRAAGIASARRAAGLPVPELARAWTYVLLCADRAGDA